ncbi:MAG: hypothetical protein J07HX64_03024 [halophilic archaeon J07HX64]|jgi:hypothetical protein|nr:MAG: hypothetical protein J07HX64_03024 [halophilic archaeon J07HX64]
MYDHGPPTAAERVLDWDCGVSWVAHPSETGRRASHALETEEGVWLVDPLAATDLGDLLDPLGPVVGVAVCSSWHARDAGVLARRHDVSVHVPAWMDRVAERVDAPVERYTLTPAESFRVLPCRPFPLFQEVFLFHEQTGTLVVPDSLGTVDHWRLGAERLGMPPFRRPQPPVQLRGLNPERVLVGHGSGVTERAPEALETALSGVRRSTPRALVEHGPEMLRGLADALRG